MKIVGIEEFLTLPQGTLFYDNVSLDGCEETELKMKWVPDGLYGKDFSKYDEQEISYVSVRRGKEYAIGDKVDSTSAYDNHRGYESAGCLFLILEKEDVERFFGILSIAKLSYGVGGL